MSLSSIRRGQRRARHSQRRRIPTVLTQRLVGSIGVRDMRVLYPVAMGSPRIDRSVWAGMVGTLIEQETGGNKTRFAELVGVDRKTITRWLAGGVDVSEESVRAVARALRLSPGDLLVKAGYLTAADLTAPAEAGSVEDAIITYVQSADVPPALRREILDHLAQLKVDQDRQRLTLAEQMVEMARGRRRAS